MILLLNELKFIFFGFKLVTRTSTSSLLLIFTSVGKKKRRGKRKTTTINAMCSHVAEMGVG